MIPHQKILEKFPMPDADTRVEIFLSAYREFTKAGYKAIGMDHFALETDELYTSSRTGQLYRNFMGYTVKKGGGMLGFGASAIGEIAGAFFQNVRETLAYEKKVGEASLATFRGCLLTKDDEQRKWIIQSLMCGFQLTETAFAARFNESLGQGYRQELSGLTPFFEEGILEGSLSDIRVTELGRLFVRNVAMVFDAYLTSGSKPVIYSKTV